MEILKLDAPCKDYIWGGNRLREEYGKISDADKIAESWELSCHKDGQSVIANGKDKGKTLSEYVAENKKSLGTACDRFEYFPILIKLIDAKDNLSVQVHPDNDYAMRVEGEYGKTEMWYIVDCEEGSQLIYGFDKEISREEFADRIKNNTLLEVTNNVPVHKGDVFFIESGTLHAIGKGILIAEIQQNSNTTYRVYDYGRVGKDGKPRAILGHSIPLGALGVFILWFGWYGFNGAAASDVNYLANIFLTTTIAPAVATVVTMIFTWLKNGKPDVSMCLNASLAGLVAITAPCADTDALGATIIGIVSGFLVCFGVWLLDYKLKVDDPVGAVAVHFFNGVWGSLAVGLFATGKGQNGITGLFYGGGFSQLGIQLLGVVSVCAFTAVTMFLTFYILKHTIGLRASREEELKGLDTTEHGLPSSYADFVIAGDSVYSGSSAEDTAVVTEAAPVETSVPVQHVSKAKAPISASDVKMTKVDIIANQEKFEVLKHALSSIGITGMTVSHVMGCGMQKGSTEFYRGVPVDARLLPKMKVEIVVCKVPVEKVVEVAKNALYTGKIGDGKIFVYDVENVIKVRTGEEAYEALQDND